MGTLTKGIAALVTLIIFAAIAPLFNTVVTQVMNSTTVTEVTPQCPAPPCNNPISDFLVQMVFPLLIGVLIFAILDNTPRSEQALW